METAETRRPSRHHPRADPQRVDRAVTADPRYLLPPWWAGALRAARRSPNRLVVPTRVHLAHLRHRKPLAAPTQAFSCSCSQQHSSMLRQRGILRARSNSMQHSHPLPMWVHQTLLQSLRRRRWHCNQGARLPPVTAPNLPRRNSCYTRGTGRHHLSMLRGLRVSTYPMLVKRHPLHWCLEHHRLRHLHLQMDKCIRGNCNSRRTS